MSAFVKPRGSCHIILELLIFYQFFLSVQWSVIVSNNGGISEFPLKYSKEYSRFIGLL